MQKLPNNASITKQGTEVYRATFVPGLPADGVETRVLIWAIINMNEVIF